MAELTIKIEVPVELKDIFEKAFTKALRQFEIDLKFAIADIILSKSKLTEEQIKKLADELKGRVAKKHGI